MVARKLNYTIIIIHLAFIYTNSSLGQSNKPEVVNSAGWSATLNNNIFDISVGEMTMISTFSSGNLITTQGLLQPIDLPTDVCNLLLLEDNKVYPNPSSGIINSILRSKVNDEVLYRLIDVNGRTICEYKRSVKAGYNHHIIDISTTIAGSYYLELIISGQATHNRNKYKVVKI